MATEIIFCVGSIQRYSSFSSCHGCLVISIFNFISESHKKINVTIFKILRILQVEAIRTLLEQSPDILPIACGGGGIPVSRIPSNPWTLTGVEAVIDKDRCGAKLANELDADGYIILTDGGGIWQNFGKPDAREMKRASPEYLLGTKAGKNFPGSMGPKIQAAIDFVQNSEKEGAWAAIGDLKDAGKIMSNEEGTVVREDVEEGVVWRESKGAAEANLRQSKDQHRSG